MAGPRPLDARVRERMQRQRVRDTTPELALRRELHRRGLRFRLQRRPVQEVRRTADIVFGPSRVAVDVRGCFWHSCPEHGNVPKHNREWWEAKLAQNARRDVDTLAAWGRRGWNVVVVWEHEDPVEAADRVERVVRARRPGDTHRQEPIQ